MHLPLIAAGWLLIVLLLLGYSHETRVLLYRVLKRFRALSEKPRRPLLALLAGTMMSTLMMQWMLSNMSLPLTSGAWVPAYRLSLTVPVHVISIFAATQLVTARLIVRPGTADFTQNQLAWLKQAGT